MIGGCGADPTRWICGGRRDWHFGSPQERLTHGVIGDPDRQRIEASGDQLGNTSLRTNRKHKCQCTRPESLGQFFCSFGKGHILLRRRDISDMSDEWVKAWTAFRSVDLSDGVI